MDAATFHRIQPTKPLSAEGQTIFDVLCMGERWRRDELSRVTGIRDRAVQLAMRELRLAGVPVMAGESRSDAGYWIESDPEKFGELVARMKSAVAESHELIAAMERTEQRLVVERGLPPVQVRLLEVS